MTWDSAKEILCVRLDAMGDVLMTSPAIRALRDAVPGRRITLLTSNAGAAIARLIPEVDDVIVYDSPWMKATPDRGSGPDLRMIEELSRRRFDGAVIFTVFSQSAFPAALLCYLAGVPLRLARCRENPYQLLTDRVRETEPESGISHEVDRQLSLVRAVGATPRYDHLSLRVPPDATHRISELLCHYGLQSPWAVLHPGASAPSRRYPADRFAQVVRLLEAAGWRIVLTGARSEAGLCRTILDAADDAISLAGALSLDELVALIARTQVLVTNNTGPAHIAAAVGTPVVDLYALTNPQHTPWRVPSRVLSHDVPCRNCFRSVCPESHHLCLTGVAPEQVASAAVALLGAVTRDPIEGGDSHVHIGHQRSVS